MRDRIDKALRLDELELPSEPRVVELHWDFADQIAYEAIRVWAIVAEDTPDGQLRWEALEPIERAIHDALRSRGVYKIPFVKLRTEAQRPSL